MTADHRSPGQLPEVAGRVQATRTHDPSVSHSVSSAVPRAVVGLRMEDPQVARAVLSWAIAWALEHGARLDVLISRSEGAVTPQRRTAVRALIDTFLDELGGSGIPVSLHGTTEPAGPALVRSAHDADLLVVGGGERVRYGWRRPGPVLTHCLIRAGCPVLVVPCTGGARTTSWSITVGVDGSARSRAALRRARWEAATPGDLTVVTVVDDDHGWPKDQSWSRPVARVRRDREDRRDIDTDTDTGTLTVTPRPRHHILPGRPVGVLSAQPADLLVVGAPARRTAWGWLPTSTVRRCLAHSQGAVLMVPFAERRSRRIR